MANPAPIQRADPRARLRAHAIVAVGAIVGVLAIWGSAELGRHVRDLAETDRAGAVRIARIVLWGGGAALLLPLFAFCAYLWRLAGRVHAAGRFPPPGASLVRDVRVLEGRAARVYARLTQGFVFALLACGIALFHLLMRLLACLERSNPPG